VIGVVVPTRNGGARFVRCLDGLLRQRPAADAVVVIDSGSSDGTAAAARRAGARVLAIAPEDFDHGETRNRRDLPICCVTRRPGNVMTRAACPRCSMRRMIERRWASWRSDGKSASVSASASVRRPSMKRDNSL